MTISKTINPFSAQFVRQGNVFIKIELKNGNLSISGVEAPLSNGNALGSCGQICKPLSDYKNIRFKKGWSEKLYNKFIEIWQEWHLNDLQAGCEHQRIEKWEDVRIDPKELPDDTIANRDERGILAIWVRPKEHLKGLLTKPCSICGYAYGSAWLKKEIPIEVIDFLIRLPISKIIPAWV